MAGLVFRGVRWLRRTQGEKRAIIRAPCAPWSTGCWLTKTLGGKVVHHRRIPGAPARYREPARPLPGRAGPGPAVAGDRAALHASGRGPGRRPRGRQRARGDAHRVGQDAGVRAPRAGGRARGPRGPGALPLSHQGAGAGPARAASAISPGPGALPGRRASRSTTATRRRHVRKKIKADPPEVLITNPDMLHLGILARHQDWDGLPSPPALRRAGRAARLPGRVRRHVHHILRRLLRLCARMRARPRCWRPRPRSATRPSSRELLVGEPFHVVADSGAPRAAARGPLPEPRHGLPLHRRRARAGRGHGERGSARSRSPRRRKITELLHTWLARQAPGPRGARSRPTAPATCPRSGAASRRACSRASSWAC